MRDVYLEQVRLAVTALSGTILDLGCGRGGPGLAWTGPGTNPFDLRSPGRRVIGIDVDPAGASNPFLDEFRLLEPGGSWPLNNGEVDLVVCDWVIEHIDDAVHFASEAARVLAPGGMLLARTVNKWSLPAIGARLVPQQLHFAILSALQPSRQSIDVFPTRYRLNTPLRVQQILAKVGLQAVVRCEPGTSAYIPIRAVARCVLWIEERLPGPIRHTLIIDARKV